MKKKYTLKVAFPGYKVGDVVETDDDGKFRLRNSGQVVAMKPESNPQCFAASLEA